MDTTNVNILRRIIKAFIKADARTIVLRRQTLVDSGAGGWIRGQPTLIPAQVFRLIPMKRRLSDLVANTQDGNIPSLQYVMIGMWNCNIKADDEFYIEDTWYRVIEIEPHTNERDKTDRVVAQIEMRGS